MYTEQRIKGKKYSEHVTRMTVGRIQWKILLEYRAQEGWQRDNVKNICLLNKQADWSRYCG